MADDWQCRWTGPVQDIHFWGSWKDGIAGTIQSFKVEIYSDVPVGPGEPYSHPGDLLWEREFFTWAERETIPVPQVLEGWYDPVTAEIIPEDHYRYYQYNIVDIVDPLVQEKGTIYWLFICAQVQDPPGGEWGWKTADVDQYPEPYTGDHFRDNACVTGLPAPAPLWSPLYDPLEPTQSLDLAFVITGPKMVPTVSEWGLVVLALLIVCTAGVIIYRRARKVPT